MHPLLATSETVVFDLDGTLVHASLDFSRLNSAGRVMAETAGYPVDQLKARDALGIIYEVEAWLPETQAHRFRLDAFAELEAIESEYCLGVPAREGASELIYKLGEVGIAVGVMTRNSGRLARLMLEGAGVQVGCVIARDDVGRVKPDPEHIWTVLAALGMPRQGICVIGDHEMDVRAGRNVKAATIGVLPIGKPETHFDTYPPDLVVRELTDLLWEGGAEPALSGAEGSPPTG